MPANAGHTHCTWHEKWSQTQFGSTRILHAVVFTHVRHHNYTHGWKTCASVLPPTLNISDTPSTNCTQRYHLKPLTLNISDLRHTIHHRCTASFTLNHSTSEPDERRLANLRRSHHSNNNRRGYVRRAVHGWDVVLLRCSVANSGARAVRPAQWLF